MSDTGNEPVSATEGPATNEPATNEPQVNETERAELQRLRAEIAELRSQPHLRTRRHRLDWRRPVAALLIVLGCLLAPVSVLAVWYSNQVSDTGRYIENIEPLIHNPAIQNALTDRVTVEIVSHLNVAGLH